MLQNELHDSLSHYCFVLHISFSDILLDLGTFGIVSFSKSSKKEEEESREGCNRGQRQ